ncbi:MAG: alpha-glucan family phosphorylase [Gemmatimonadota bacterium]
MRDDPTTAIPERIGGLLDLAMNLWWTWQPAARALFRRLDYPLWRMTNHNAVAMLRRVEPEKLQAAARDPLFLREYDAIMAELEAVLSDRRSWYRERHSEIAQAEIGYFCAEFGVHASIPIYSGGLGILAGDHFKEATDLGMPLIGCGLLYQKGYFRQRIGTEGEQYAVEEPFDAASMPIELVGHGDGDDGVRANVQLDSRLVHIRVWRLRLGHTSIYLLDTDIEQNDPADRFLSHQLYGGDLEIRLRQEIVLGIGGVRVLRALGHAPVVWHANEGHAAFLLLERLREWVRSGFSFEEARRRVAATTVFTTHTPVPAGHDAFPAECIDHYFSSFWPELGLDRAGFYALGSHPCDDGRFHMTALALRLSDYRNGVSERHGEVARRMWAGLWPDREEAEVPIGHVTNGVHLPTWVAPEFRELFDRYLGPKWELRQADAALWERALDLPDEAVWTAHAACKRRLFAVLRERASSRWMDRRSEARQVVASGTLLDPEALTLGFARRFATYKRAALLFRDPERLRSLLLDPWKPVQIIFAGKAHPADEPGRRLISEIYRAASDPQFGGRIAFVEDYEMHVAKELVAGVDVWVNLPRPPMEASGTSGQKAAVNGVPHLSTLDGWWAEGFTRRNGWAVGTDTSVAEDPDPEARDEADAESLYRILEEEVRELYYRQDADGIPRGWVRTMKQAIRTGGVRFSARRMVREYCERFYSPAARAAAEK